MKDFFDELIDALAEVCGVTEEKLKKQDRIAELMVEKEKKFPELPDAVIKFLEDYGENKAEEPKEENVKYPKYVVDFIDLKEMEDGCYGICVLEEYEWDTYEHVKKPKVFRKLGTKVEYFNRNCEPCGYDYVDTCCDKDGYLTVKATYDYTVTDYKGLLKNPLGYAITAMTKDFYNEVR